MSYIIILVGQLRWWQMKFDKQKAFPYPVLRPYNDDFVGKDFQGTISIEIEEEFVNITIDYSLSSKSIQNLLDERVASLVTVVSCRETYFSQSIESFDFRAEKRLLHGLFRGEVYINKYIQILDEVYLGNEEIHEDFGSGPFLYTAGDIIAQDEPEKFYFGREFFKPVTSIFSLVKNDSLLYGDWKLNADNDYIGIEVNPTMKEKFDIARSSRNNQMILMNSLYYAAVVQAVEYLKEQDDVYSEYRWAQVIKNKIAIYGLIIEEPATKIASTLLDFPLRMLGDSVFSEGSDQ